MTHALFQLLPGRALRPRELLALLVCLVACLAWTSHLAAAQTHLYWSNTESFEKIARSKTDAPGAEAIVVGMEDPAEVGFDPVDGKIYWVDFDLGSVMRANADGSDPEEIISGLRTPGAPPTLSVAGVAVDPIGRKVYTSGNGIRRSDLDGSNAEFLTSGAISRSIALNVGTGKMYFTSHFGDIIQADLDGMNRITVVSGLWDPRGLAIDATNGKLYWTTGNGSAIRPARVERSNLDGTTVETLVESVTPAPTPIRFPESVAVDPASGKVYWADKFKQVIHVANLDGSAQADFVTGLDDPVGVTIDPAGGKIYWTDSGTLKVQRASLADGSGVEDVVTTEARFPAGIAVDGVGGKVYWADLDFSGPTTLKRANLDGSSIEGVLSGLPASRGVALDRAGGKVYWVQSDNIQRANLDGTDQEQILGGLNGPLRLAINPVAGKLYWTSGQDETIFQSNLDGTGAVPLIAGAGVVDLPLGIALDVAGGKVYWSDVTLNRVSRANLDGSNPEILVAGQFSARGMAVDPTGKIYWSVGGEIRRSELDGSTVESFLDLPGVVGYLALSSQLDYGDAPDGAGMPTLSATGGAAHAQPTTVYLGSSVPDIDADGQPSALATGDDLDAGGDDEDGVSITATVYSHATLVASSSLTVATSGAGNLHVWVDSDADGAWAQPAERVFSAPVTSGTTIVPFPVVPGVAPGSAYLRARFCSTADCDAPGGVSADGEVEDHLLEVVTGAPPVSVTLPESGLVQPVTVRIDGANQLEVIDGAGSVLFSAPNGSVQSLSITGTTTDDHLIVDYVNGSPIPTDGIDFDGKGQTAGDLVTVTGGTVGNVIHTLINDHDGTIQIDGEVIRYIDLEPVIDLLVAVNRTFLFTGGAETITLGDDATPGDGLSIIDSDLGESVTFPNPSGTLLVRAGTGQDVLTFLGFDAAAVVPANVIFEGNEDADLFRITPSSSHSMLIDGGAPSSCPGDVLDLIGGFSGPSLVVSGPGTGAWSFASGELPVSFIRMETRADANTDIAVTAAWDLSTAYPADEREVTFTLRNDGPEASSCLSPAIQLPPILEVLAGYPVLTGGSFLDPTWTVDALGPGQEVSITFRGLVNEQSVSDHVASIDATGALVPSADPDPDNNSASATLSVLPIFRFPAKGDPLKAVFTTLPSGLDRLVVGLFQGAPGFDTALLCRIPDAAPPLWTPVGLGDHWRPCGAGLPYPLHVNDLLLDDKGTASRDDDRIWLASWGSAGLYFSDDFGETFQAFEPALGAQRGWVNVYTITKDAGSVLYISANNGLVFRSLNDGTTWQQVGSLPQVSADTPWSMVSHPTEAGTVFAGTFGRGVFVTTDFGFTWDYLGGTAINEGLLDLDGSGDFAGHVFDLAFSPDTNGYVFAGTGRGVWRLPLDPAGVPIGNWEMIDAPVLLDAGLTVPEVRALAFRDDSDAGDADGNDDDDLLIGTWGLGVFLNANPTAPAAPPFLPLTLKGEHVTFFVDTPGGLLIGSRESGLEVGDFQGGATPTAMAEERTLPAGFSLKQNYPNPFNPVTVISFETPEAARIRVSVYDLLGREVSVLADGVLQAGHHRVRFDARGLPSGAYIYRMLGPGFSATKRLVLLR
jgi:GEVED domain/Domain of unknown function DUF11/Secretion system C-terminal sorting domain